MDRSRWWRFLEGARPGAGDWPDQESGVYRSGLLLGELVKLAAVLAG
jgi:hypothetical protein